MNKNKKNQEESEEKPQIFSNFQIPEKAEYIKSRINSGKLTIKKNNKILKTVDYGNDVNFQKYMIYLDNLRRKEEEELLELLKQKNKKNPLLSKLDINKKISFPEFCDKYKINPFLMNYFDYYEIQKINKKQTAELIKKIKNQIIISEKSKRENNKENNSDDDYLEEDNKQTNLTENIDDEDKHFYRRMSLIGLQNLNRNNNVGRKSILIENLDKNNIYIEGIDFNLIKNLYPEIERNEKKMQKLCIINEIKKEMKQYYKKMENSYKKRNSKSDNNKFLPDEYTISHSLDTKNQKKLNHLKLLINKRLDKYRAKTTIKNLSNNDMIYLNYIPNSSKYKHINYYKNLIFNNDYSANKTLNKNKHRALYNNLKTESNIYSNNDLMIKSNKLINNLNQIKSVLKKDKNYTSKTINRASTAFRNRAKFDQRFMEGLMNNNKKTIKKIKEIKEKMEKKEKFHVFQQLKEIIKSNEKNRIETTDKFTKTINELFKEEKKENKKYNNFMKNNFYLKLEGINEDNIENLKTKKNLENLKLTYEKIKLKIKKRYKEINNIFKMSKKKSKSLK